MNRIMKNLAGSCAEMTRLGSDSRLRSLTFRERMQARFHMLICAGCRVYRRQMELLSRVADWPRGELSSESRKRMVDRLVR